jgi:hypothetical protein
MLRGSWSIAATGLILCACQATTEKSNSRAIANGAADPCAPSFRRVSEQPISARSGALEVSAVVVLIGCSEELARITEIQLEELAASVVPAMILKESQLWERATRSRTVSQVNGVLGVPLVTDVFAYRLRVSEFELLDK